MNKINCELCNQEYTKKYFKTHLKTKKHKLNEELKKAEENKNADVDKIECSICFIDIENINMHETKCKHKFHNECINKWKEEKNTCPLC